MPEMSRRLLKYLLLTVSYGGDHLRCVLCDLEYDVSREGSFFLGFFFFLLKFFRSAHLVGGSPAVKHKSIYMHKSTESGADLLSWFPSDRFKM